MTAARPPGRTETHMARVVQLTDGTTRVIEYRSVRGDEPGVNVSAWRELALIEAGRPAD